jgi:DDE superfamily endonuclease/Helix-turn-helix of DDE superfamily endonuclease
MITYASLKHKPSVFSSFTGLTLAAFNQLLPAFVQGYEADRDRLDQQREQPRQRRRGGGRSGALDKLEDKLVFILFYFKYYPVQVVQGYLFGLGQPQANEWIHRLTPILNQALGYECRLPARKTRDISQILAACPGLEFIIDGSERPIRRPKDQQKQRQHYSGKKKRYTVKNNIIIDKRTRKIKVLSPTGEGKTHDKKLADEQAVTFPVGSKLWKDTGFQGYEPDHVQTFQPKKKPKGGELTPPEKASNTVISSQRIAVEHTIGGVKVYHIVRDVFRNIRPGFDDLVMETACGLHNLRLDYPLTLAR